MCTLSYYGAMLNGGSAPAPQTSSSIQAGGQLTFSLSTGNAAQGIAATPGFRGYVIADCSFPVARGMADVIVPPPSLSIAKVHTGDFVQGQQNVTYTITVSNQGGAGPTSGTVSVIDVSGEGLTVVSMAGTGWTCTTLATPTCTRSDPLAAGGSYPPITATVNVSVTAPMYGASNYAGVEAYSVTWGAYGASAVDVATILTTDLNNDGVTDVSDVQLMINEVLGVSPATVLYNAA